MANRSVVDGARLARRAYENGGASGLAATAVEYAIRRPHVHPRLHWRIASAYYRRRCANDVARAAAPTDPFKLEWVSTDRIARHTRREYPPYRDRLWLFGAVRGGDWDRRSEPPIDRSYDGPPARLFVADRFEETVLYRSFEAHFDRGILWEETPLVREALRLVRESPRDRVWHECRTESEVRDRCRRLDELYETIRREGYRAERHRLGDDPDVGFRHCLLHEITVDVGRDGELLLVCGKHRLAIAKLLGVDRVPVVFHVRHPDWMRRRRAVARGDRSESHPDLRDLDRSSEPTDRSVSESGSSGPIP